jgi:hypothetical protein
MEWECFIMGMDGMGMISWECFIMRMDGMGMLKNGNDNIWNGNVTEWEWMEWE